MTLRFWRLFACRSRSTISSISDNSAIPGVSVTAPDSISRLARSADRLSLAAEIAACIVVAGIVLEDWNKFAKLFYYPSWMALRDAAAPIMVAGGIAFEILLSRLSSSQERKIRDWYAMRVAELNLKSEQESVARAKLERLTEKLRKNNRRTALLLRDRNLSNRVKFIEAMRAFASTRVYIHAMKEHEADPESSELESILRNTLRDAGWRVEAPVTNRLVIPPPAKEGVHIEYPASDWYSDRPLPYVAAGCGLADWLNKENIATEIGASDHLKNSGDICTVIVSVGPKPSTLGMIKELKYRGDWKYWRDLAKRPQEYESISQEDVDSIRDQLSRVGGGMGRFLKYMHVARVEDILLRDLKKACDALRAKARDRPQ
jgi:hypothetical protein